jgi:uncharacterized protein (DUF2147 family)
MRLRLKPRVGTSLPRSLLAVFAFLLAVGLLGWPAGPAQAQTQSRHSPVGRWLTQDGDGVIEIYACGGALCGRIVGMSDLSRADGGPIVDKQGRRQCGLTILRETAQTDTHVWEGRITNPDDGSTWTCEFWVESDGLHLRGYVLLPVLGQTQIWRPYTGRLEPNCRMG